MLRMLRVLALIVVGLTCTQEIAEAQRVLTVPSTPACEGCGIGLQRVVTLGRSGGPSLMRGSKVAVDTRGHFVVAPTYNPGEIVMYSPAGVPIRSFGRSGQGPGEFERIQKIWVGPGDTVHVFEANRHTVLAPGLASLVRVEMLPVNPQYLAFLNDGRMVAQGMVEDARGIGQPLQLMGSGGEVTKSFGGEAPWNPREIYLTLRAIAPASSNRLWSALIPAYRIELWNSDGSRERTLVRDADWFRPWNTRDLRQPMEALERPRLSSIAEDARGRLWVNVSVADENYEVLHGPEISEKGQDPDVMFDTILEVLDPRSGRVIAHARHDWMIGGFIGRDPLVTTTREDAIGNILIDVWRVVLKPAS